MTIQEFLKRESKNLMQLMQEVHQYYGRKPGIFLIGPDVEPFGNDVKFMEVPIRREASLEDGEVFALLDNATVFDKVAAARGSSRPMVSRSNLSVVK